MVWLPTSSVEIVNVDVAVFAPLAVTHRAEAEDRRAVEELDGPGGRPAPLVFVMVAVKVTFCP